MIALWLLVCAPRVRAQGPPSPFIRPAGVAYDSAGDLFVADANRNQVFEITVGGTLVVVAGTGTQGFGGDGGPATAAELNAPMAVAVGPDGTLYIADSGNDRVRAVQGGAITTFAGKGTRGYSGDGGLAVQAQLNRPVALAVDSAGALLICDQGNERVRRVSGGQIATIAGNGMQGFAGDGLQATAAELDEPSGVTVGVDGRIFIADTANERVRVISTGGVISTFAGTGVVGDTGAGSQMELNRPTGLAVDAANDLYIVDRDNHRLLMMSSGGAMTTVAGSGVQGSSPEGLPALQSSQNAPAAAAVSSFGWPLVADSATGALRILFSDGRLYAPAGLSSRTTVLSVQSPDSVYGQASVSVSAAGSPAISGGAVGIAEGGAGSPLATSTLAGGGAQIALPELSAGAHTLTASYAGDGLHPAATATATVVISPLQVTATPDAATVAYGAPLPTLTGSLASVLPQDQASVQAVFAATAPSLPPVGAYPIGASLAGAASGNYSVSLAPGGGQLTVVPAATIASLQQAATDYAGLPWKLSAQVASATSGTPTGTVTFFDAGNIVATAPLVNGTATAVELSPASGTHSLSISYSGDSNYKPSVSGNVLEAVNAMPDFTVAVSGGSQQTVIAGSSAVYSLNVASSGASFTGAVMMSASGLPAGAAAIFSPPAVVPGASAALVTMTVTTSASVAGNADSPTGLVVTAFGVMVIFTLRRRRPAALLLTVVAGAVLLGLAGCGARTASEATLPVHSYAVQIKATSTNLAGGIVVHTAAVTLGVE